LDAAWRLDRPELGETALEVLDSINKKARVGSLSHVFDQSGMHPTAGLLTDWANLLNAQITAYTFTGLEPHLTRATELAKGMIEAFFDAESGGFFDIQRDANAIGHLEIREKPLPDNADAALALLKLHQVTRNDDYRHVAETTLSCFVQSYREFGEFAAPYGLAVHNLNNSPVEVTVEGRHQDPDTSAMLRAAFQLTTPHLEVKPIVAKEHGIPVQAHICMDTVCLPPVANPNELANALAELSDSNTLMDSPFESIFKRFPEV